MRLFTSEQSPANHISKPDLQHVLVMQLGNTSAAGGFTSRRTDPHRLCGWRSDRSTAALVDNVMIDQALGWDGSGNRVINHREDVVFVERLRLHNFSIALIFTSVAQSPLRRMPVTWQVFLTASGSPGE